MEKFILRKKREPSGSESIDNESTAPLAKRIKTAHVTKYGTFSEFMQAAATCSNTQEDQSLSNDCSRTEHTAEEKQYLYLSEFFALEKIEEKGKFLSLAFKERTHGPHASI